MLLWLAQNFQQDFSFLRVFNFITFRAVFATLTALLIGLAAGPAVIRMLTLLKVGQAVRTDVPGIPQFSRTCAVASSPSGECHVAIPARRSIR